YGPVTDTDPAPTRPWQKIAGAVLRPGEDVLIRIPFRTPDCWLNGWSVVSSFSVTTKFLAWTRTFDVSWTLPQDPYGGAIMTKLPSLASSCPHR
ncbi:MAG TPA: hypothetical protein VFI65_21015, partial [Streptosporangiaceae bacterium]|nr:hypothetical protein [Streptosporangiaceae bacterium]